MSEQSRSFVIAVAVLGAWFGVEYATLREPILKFVREESAAMMATLCGERASAICPARPQAEVPSGTTPSPAGPSGGTTVGGPTEPPVAEPPQDRTVAGFIYGGVYRNDLRWRERHLSFPTNVVLRKLPGQVVHGLSSRALRSRPWPDESTLVRLLPPEKKIMIVDWCYWIRESYMEEFHIWMKVAPEDTPPPRIKSSREDPMPCACVMLNEGPDCDQMKLADR
jgi:hypothetical protein